MNGFVDYINNNKFSWKAEVNPRFKGLTLSQLKEEKYHSHHATHVMRTLSQTNTKAIDKSDNEKLLKNEDFIKVWNDVKKHWNTSIESFPDTDLPKSWDWRDVQGYDFTTPVRD